MYNFEASFISIYGIYIHLWWKKIINWTIFIIERFSLSKVHLNCDADHHHTLYILYIISSVNFTLFNFISSFMWDSLTYIHIYIFLFKISICFERRKNEREKMIHAMDTTIQCIQFTVCSFACTSVHTYIHTLADCLHNCPITNETGSIESATVKKWKIVDLKSFNALMRTNIDVT